MGDRVLRKDSFFDREYRVELDPAAARVTQIHGQVTQARREIPISKDIELSRDMDFLQEHRIMNIASGDHFSRTDDKVGLLKRFFDYDFLNVDGGRLPIEQCEVTRVGFAYEKILATAAKRIRTREMKYGIVYYAPYAAPA